MKLRPFLLADCATRLCRNRIFPDQIRKKNAEASEGRLQFGNCRILTSFGMFGGSFLSLQRGLNQSPEKFVRDGMNQRSLLDEKSLSTPNYRDCAKILLVIRVDSDKSGEHEMCSSVYLRFPRICFADICGCAAALSCQTRTATWRGYRHRRRSGSKSVEKFSACHIPIIRGGRLSQRWCWRMPIFLNRKSVI
jgi:hypothetical protein